MKKYAMVNIEGSLEIYRVKKRKRKALKKMDERLHQDFIKRNCKYIGECTVVVPF
jgi:hypothetical protein